MKLSSTTKTWTPPVPQPFQFVLQVKTNTAEAAMIRQQLRDLLRINGLTQESVNGVLTLTKSGLRHDGARLVMWLAENLDENSDHPETEL